MKIGDLVRWDNDRDAAIPGRVVGTGIVVDGPRRDDSSAAISYAVAWFDAKTTFWHNDHNLELLSENR